MRPDPGPPKFEVACEIACNLARDLKLALNSLVYVLMTLSEPECVFAQCLLAPERVLAHCLFENECVLAHWLFEPECVPHVQVQEVVRGVRGVLLTSSGGRRRMIA